MKKRLTYHSGRINKRTNKPYSLKHDDRSFDISKADNIDPDRVKDNIIIFFDKDHNGYYTKPGEPKTTTVDEHVHNIYTEIFGPALNAQNSRNVAARHPERNRTIDKLIHDKNTCPEEVVLQVGSVRDGTVARDSLIQAAMSIVTYLIEKYGDNIQILYIAFHFDEAVPHAHISRTWKCHSKDEIKISQNKALEEMGVPLPSPDKTKNAWNHRKIVFSIEERKMAIDVCHKYGIEIEETALYPGKSSMEKEEAIAKILHSENLEKRQRLDELDVDINNKEKIIAQKTKEFKSLDHKTVERRNLLSKEEQKRLKANDDKTVMGREKKISITVSEYNRLLAGTVTREEFIRERKELNKRNAALSSLEKKLDSKEKELKTKEQKMEKRFNEYLEERVLEALPYRVKQKINEIQNKEAEQSAKEEELKNREEELRRRQAAVRQQIQQNDELAEELDRKEKRISERIKEFEREVAEYAKARFRDVFVMLSSYVGKKYKPLHLQKVRSITGKLKLTDEVIKELNENGYRDLTGKDLAWAERMAIEDDIKDALQESDNDLSNDIVKSDIKSFQTHLEQGMPYDEAVETLVDRVMKRGKTHDNPGGR